MQWSFLYGLVHLSTTTTAAFTGLGVRYNDPSCVYACRASISSAPLACSGHGHGDAHSHGAPPTSPECRGEDTAFLTTLAYCISTHCQDVPLWRVEQYWALQATGSPAALAKWDYSTALSQVTTAPNKTYVSATTLDYTALVNAQTVSVQQKFILVLEKMTTIQNVNTLAILTVGFATPILCTLLGMLPFMTKVLDKLKPYLVYPSTIGQYQVRPLPWLLGNTPTIGQSLYIVMFFILNLVLSMVGYESAQPHPWGYNKRGELLAYAGYRTGNIAFALLPLTILFSGRNNILLWMTNWSRSTYLLLHRWVARFFAIHTILHSIFLLAAYKQSGIFSVNYYEPYWLWGIVGTVFTCAMLIFSHLWFRRVAYELFLIAHIIMAIFVIVGSWYHLYYRFGLSQSYEYWLYAACAVWFFDRLLRVLRITKNGMQRATVMEIGSNHVRVDISGIRWATRPGYHAFVFFPTLNPLRPWENHPFSVNAASLFRPAKPSLLMPSNYSHQSLNDRHDVEKSVGHATESRSYSADMAATGNEGITLIVRKNTGLTKLLQKHDSLLALVEGPYPNGLINAILRCDRVLLIGGGIGITGLVGWVSAHNNTKLAWSVNESARAVVDHLHNVLDVVTDKQILIGQRLNVNALLLQEVQSGWNRVGVVVCGPGGLCDSVRAEVARLGRHEKTVFELEVEAYSW